MENLVVLNVAKGAHMESQSGIQMRHPKVYGNFANNNCSKDIAFVVIHPTSNFHGHYLLEPMQRRGKAILALNTRFVANDTMLLMERAIQDLGAGVRYLRDEGYKKVVLIGNSGGGSLATLYQSQAEKLTIKDTPDGRPIDLAQDQLPPADALILLAAHPGRAITLTEWIDPSVVDEHDPITVNKDLDMYNPDNGPPYDREWLKRYRQAQQDRNRRLTDRVVARLAYLESLGSDHPAKDEAFVIYRTMADPRFLDMTLDPSDRKKGILPWGPADKVNYAPNNIGRFSTLRSFLSQWSKSHSRADGPACLAKTTVPVLNVNYTGDELVFPSDIKNWNTAAEGRCEYVEFKGVAHYPDDDSDMVDKIADQLADWAS